MAKIKICGLMRMEDIEAVNEAKPDYIGFVFAKGGKRTVSHETAAELKRNLCPDIKAVGVFLNNSVEEVSALADQGIIDIIQLHGDEDEEYITDLRSRTVQPIVKAVRVRTEEEIFRAERLPVDYLLLDTYKKGAYGGTGETFDWSRIPQLQKPFFLAGGLDESNITAAAGYGAYCLDVSSGVETDGKKDRQKIINLVRKVRSEL
ncbi:MAG: phosphoribosylanthranilate isomerase [Clostridia bacterium]|nr:phosphoribosylanthranilate isomerase [Clostridia bacterium]